MSDPATSAETFVLHVRPESPGTGQTDKLRCCIADAGLNEQSVTDVYRALAQVSRTDHPRPQALIVCTEGLSSAELEFFSIVARIDRSLPVFVYGSTHQSVRLARAVALGAKELTSKDDLMLLRAQEKTEPTPIEQASSAAIPVAEPAPIDEGPQPDAAVSHQDSDVTPVDEPDDTEAVEPRVPWQRYGQTPARTAPVRNQPPTNDHEKPEPPQARRVAPEPLVSEEELRALIGDPMDTHRGEGSA